jgi:hypothetical protein
LPSLAATITTTGVVVVVVVVVVVAVADFPLSYQTLFRCYALFAARIR